MSEPIIQRYFSRLDVLENITNDFKSLIQIVNRYPDEYVIQLRKNYFNVYHKGMSLAKITPRAGTYAVSISNKFLHDDLRYKMSKACGGRTRNRSANTEFVVEPNEIRRFFRVDHLNGLKSNITGNGVTPELQFEQVLMSDNPASDTFIIIDRQIAATGWKGRLDLLALVRNSATGPFHFLVIEVKMGNNEELERKVGDQLQSYIEHIDTHINDYVACYEKNYLQRNCMGLITDAMPASIEIENSVKGMVITGGYSRLAEKATTKLQEQFDIRVQIMKNVIIPS